VNSYGYPFFIIKLFYIYFKRQKKASKPIEILEKNRVDSYNESGGGSMSQITLRDLDPDIEKRTRQEARKSKKSLNRVIQEMLQLKTDSLKTKRIPRGQSLKSLAGGWSDQDAAEFFESIKSCEQIDEDMCK
jgi:hypothetical protein